MDQKRLHALEDQCIQDWAPPCTALCPVHVDVRTMVSQITAGDYPGAYRTYIKTVPFPRIVARICEQPCQAGCLRCDLGGSIDIAALERACCDLSAQEVKSGPILPPKNKKIAVVGAGLSGATLALECAKKGYRIVLFETQEHPGGRLWQIPDELLPKAIIAEDYALLSRYPIEIRLDTKAGRDISWKELLEQFDAIYLGVGEHAALDMQQLSELKDGYNVDPSTFATPIAGVFAGGSALHTPSPILSISDGRRAATSIDRYLQKVSLTASRVLEGPYETRLYTNLAGIDPVPQVTASQPDKGYSEEEARREAERCIRCDCMECVKACVYLSHYGSYPRKYVRDIYNNLTIIMRVRTANKFINSCLLCGLCSEVCPEDFDMGTVCKDARQHMVKVNKMPVSAHEFALRDMAFSNSEKCNLALSPQEEQVCEAVFFPGCQLSASYPEYVPQVYDFLRATIPNLGILLRCCGAPAEWAGREDLLRASLDELRQTLASLGNPRLILPCSSCYQVFKRHLPEVAIVSLWEFFTQTGFPPPKSAIPGQAYALHDPCSTRYENGIQDGVRHILGKMGVEIQELPYTRAQTKCCGYGGLAWLANPALVQEVIQERVGESELDYLTYCAMCRDLFSSSGKRILHVLDLFFGDDLNALAGRKKPGYSQRQANRLTVKQTIARMLRGRSPEALEGYEKIKLSIPGEVAEILENRRILVEDVQKVIEAAESSGSRFLNGESQHYLAFHRPAYVTYWVEYSMIGEEYHIHNAYSHRMEIEGNVNP